MQAITALCYIEFAVDMPVAGSAFNYISLVFGEFPAWVAAIEMVMEYTLTSSAVAKGFSSYFATLIGLKSDQLFLYKNGWFVIDPVAFALVLLLSLLLAFGVKESSRFNVVVSGINVAVVIFIIAMSVSRIDTDNYTPFLLEDKGLPGVFTAVIGVVLWICGV
ncbi:hypothetical protein BSKO_08262 [Bryopsis sp. KO-2023]|nr:hypothetical protein BSKO_08262 [Bryopsis sp. KO-2023]